MEKRVKLIWDFRGPQSLQTANHHEIHLKDYIAAEKLEEWQITGIDKYSEMHNAAYWVVPESQMQKFREILKPHRATWYEE
ncbi:hypothetical protein SAMN04487764_0039 [Gillisia sp. Hel1_33_143]|uniref:hypothetical protein n=1 Tax=unclassified Gillisia TaxID=2615025 RepID=UPI0005561C5E|nr:MULTISPECIES: hypothetical protein [unclassified Gillisia]SDR66183.1 hypothetical protein SAMN04487764_0039 [Gillisia sp. Hel1_33_143]